MAVAAFSHFSAVSELFVTAAVFYFFRRAVRWDDYRWTFIWIVIAFETLVNITYMVARLASSSPKSDHPALVTWLLAGHGTLSLFMFIGLIAFVMLAFRAAKVEKANLFRANPVATWTFVALWTLSVLTGEALYVLQLTGVLKL